LCSKFNQIFTFAFLNLLGQLLTKEPDKQIENECEDDEDEDDEDDDEDDEDNDDRNRSNQPNGNNEDNEVDEEEKERLTNQRLDALAYNFMQSLNLREPDLHETYL
jgi:nonsense-mediated mRNA decay protein 2